MKQPPCLCTGRTDIRCDAAHCDLAGPGAPGDADQCRVCWLRLNQPATPPRVLPCLFLGAVLDRLGCACPRLWLRQCELHKVCTLEQCKQCPDYEAL